MKSTSSDQPSIDEQKRRTQAVWGASPAGTTHAPEFKPGSKEFFEKARAARKDGELKFLQELIPFASFKGKNVLEIGCGVGFDAFDFCKAGAKYTGIDITPENPDRCKHHLAYYGLTPTCLQGDAEHLPFGNGTFDAVFSNGVLHHTPNIEQSFREAHRVLGPNSSFWVILYHKHSLFYWVSVVLIGHILNLGFLRRTLAARRSMIEYTESSAKPLVNVYSRREVADLLRSTGFVIEQDWVRKLNRDDLPGLPIMRRAWVFVPDRWLSALQTRIGWYVIFKASKPPAQN